MRIHFSSRRMAFAWTKEQDLKLIFAIQQTTGAEHRDGDAHNSESIDWQKVHLVESSWPKAFSLDTLRLRYTDLLQRWKAIATSRGISLLEWRRSIIEEGMSLLFLC